MYNTRLMISQSHKEDNIKLLSKNICEIYICSLMAYSNQVGQSA